jgi:outer membrane protein assembly factor BamD (BamD/ComL family)
MRRVRKKSHILAPARRTGVRAASVCALVLFLLAAPAALGQNLSTAARSRAAKAERERLVNLAKARSKALPYWIALIKRYPKSPRAEIAWYRVGILRYQLAETVYPNSEQAWKNATAALGQFTKRYPKSAYAGDAYIKQIDIALERMFDIKMATAPAQRAVAWAKARAAAKPDQSPREPLGAWCLSVRPSTVAKLRPVLYACYTRAGLVAYLARDFKSSRESFKKARSHAPPPNAVVVYGRVRTGTERLIAMAEAGQSLTPAEVLKGDGRVQLMLQLADVYFQGQDFDHGIALLDVITATRGKSATPTQRSWAHLMRGRCLYGKLKPQSARKEYLRSAGVDPKAPWASRALFFAANVTYNYGPDKKRAAVEWQRVASKYPRSREAEMAEYYIAWSYQMAGKRVEALRAYHSFLKKYPASPYASAIRTYHLAELADTSGKSSKTGE